MYILKEQASDIEIKAYIESTEKLLNSSILSSDSERLQSIAIANNLIWLKQHGVNVSIEISAVRLGKVYFYKDNEGTYKIRIRMD